MGWVGDTNETNLKIQPGTRFLFWGRFPKNRL